MFLSLFEEFDTFPELYGTCGELYVVEELQPLDIPHLLGKHHVCLGSGVGYPSGPGPRFLIENVKTLNINKIIIFIL